MAALWTYGFLQRALVAGVFIGVACAVLGVFLILRKDAMIGHGLSHITFAGVALGLLVGRMPLLVALAFSVIAALGLVKLRTRAGLHGDTAIAIMSSGGLALGIILASVARSYNAGLLAYLFGEILAIEKAEVWLAVLLAAAVLIAVLGFYHKLLFATFDRESARAAGVPVDRLEAALTVLTAVTIVLGMRVVGVLLVSALIVIPAAAALQIAASFRRAVLFSAVIGAASVVLGMMAAYLLDLPASGTIVLAALALFGGAAALRPRFI
jgi:zinc transport system permease protein